MARRITRMALLTAAGLATAWLEAMLMPSLGVPGVKPGLANIATLTALYVMGWRSAAAVCVLRVILANALFGSFSAAVYALAGGVCALCVMALMKRTGLFSETGVSAAGGCMHNAAQLCVAAAVTRAPGIFSYLPALVIAGVVAGIITGAAARPVIRLMKRNYERDL